MLNNDLRLHIAGTGMYVPGVRIKNDQFIGRPLNLYDEKGNIIGTKEWTEAGIVERTGILERRKVLSDESPSSMGYKAALFALDRSGTKADDLVGIIFATLTENENFPNAAAKLQEKLGVRGCFAVDVAYACAGFPESLIQANSRVLRRQGNYLVVASECLTRIVDNDDYNSVLFGDGAGAAVLVPTTYPVGIIAEYSMNDPYNGNLKFLYRDKKGLLRMPDGGRVLKKAVSGMVESINSVKKDAGWNRVDVYIPHQANIRIIDGVRDRINEPGEIVYNNIAKYGNMSAATCPIALHEAIEDGTIKQGSRVIITSFGAGFANAAVGIQF